MKRLYSLFIHSFDEKILNSSLFWQQTMHLRFGGQQSTATARKWLWIKWNRKAREGSEFRESAGPGGPKRLNGVWLRHLWPKSILSSVTGVLFFSSWNKSIYFLQRNQSVRKILGRLSMHMEIQHTYVNRLLKKHFAWGLGCSFRCQGGESSHCHNSVRDPV